MNNDLHARAIVLMIGLCSPGWAGAFGFILSEAEFSSWPTYCQARYASLEIGQAQPFSKDFSLTLIELERKRIGADTFERVHHWCSGMTLLNRARLETNKKIRDYQLFEAKHESLFTLPLPPNSPVMSALLVTVGQICQEQEDYNCAIDNFEKAIVAQPADPTPYSALGILQRKRKLLSLARDALNRGDIALAGNSPEIHYNLGLILLEMGDVDGALNRAHRAYLGGYPLLGLKNRLARIGRWVEPSSDGAQPPSK